MKKAILILLALMQVILLSCTKKSSDPAPSTTPANTDKGHGSFTFLGHTYFFDTYNAIPSTNALITTGGALVDSIDYIVSINVYPGPKRDTTFNNGSGAGAVVFMEVTDVHRKTSGTHFHYFYRRSDTVGYYLEGGKRRLAVAGMQETTKTGVDSTGAPFLSATLKE